MNVQDAYEQPCMSVIIVNILYIKKKTKGEFYYFTKMSAWNPPKNSNLHKNTCQYPKIVRNNYTSHILSKNHIKTNQSQIQLHHSQVIILTKNHFRIENELGNRTPTSLVS